MAISAPMRSLATGLFLILCIPPGFAQSPAPPNDPQNPLLEEVVVIGTQIRGVTESASPVTIYDRETIDRSGLNTVADFVRTMPENSNLITADSATTNGANNQAAANRSRGAGIDLHGLGSGSTLILMNGHRLAPAGSDGSFVDVSLIPLSAVDRIEVLKDGASAIYGSDAVGGVVNFVMRRKFDGAETSARYADTTRGGRVESSASQLLGTSWNSGNALLVYEYDRQDRLDAGDRDFVPAQTASYMLLPEQRRHSAFASLRQEVTGKAVLFADVLFSKRKFSQDYNDGAFLTNAQGHTQQVSAALGATYELPARWQANVTANYAREDDPALFSAFRIVPSTSFPPTVFSSRSRMASAQLHLDGPVFALAGGDVRFLAGTGVRREMFDEFSQTPSSAGTGLERDAFSVFAELSVPLIGERNAKPYARKLELSLAARFDTYDAAGDQGRDSSSVDPKVGLLWRPVSQLALRTTYSTSYRVAPLSHMSEGGNTAALVSAPNSASPTGFTNTLLLFGGNRALKPEESKSFTAGFDWQPLSTKGPSYSVSYYHIDYTDRIANPPVQGSPLLIFSQLAALSPFVNTSPTAAQIQDIMTRYPVGNQSIPGSGGAAAIFDSRRQNIASRTAEGLELTLSDDLELGANRLNVFVSANYMLELEDQAAATTATVDRLDTVFNPADLKLRGGASWARSAFSASWFVNYTDSYDNRLVSPAQEVASWLTFDLTGGVDLGDLTPSSAFKGTLVSLAVQNVFDRDPPRVNGGRAASLVAYDPSNASPLGRVVALQLRRAW